MICRNKNQKEAKNNNESGVTQTQYNNKVVKPKMRKTTYVVGTIALMMLVMTAITIMAEAETIGNVEAYTPGYEEVDNHQRYATAEWMQDGNWEWTIDWKYNQVIDGEINSVKVRGRTKDGAGELQYLRLYINGVNVGQPTDHVSFISDGSGPESTQQYWVWDDLSVDVDGGVLFELNKIAKSGSPAMRIYTGRSGTAIGTDVDNDGDLCASVELRSPDNKISGCFAGSTEYANNWWQDVDSDIIYEFTYVDQSTPVEPEPEPEPEPVETNTAPNTPRIQMPTNNDNTIDPSENLDFVATVSDNDNDDLDVFFYLDGPGNRQLLGYEETDGGVVSISVASDTFDYSTTYDWYVQVIERTSDAYSRKSNVYSFRTIDVPNDAPNTPTDVTENSLNDGDTLNVGDTFLLGVPVSDKDGDTLNVTFYLNGGAIGSVLIDGSGDATITVDSSGFAYNESFTWWATIDDGKDIVETEHRAFSTNPEEKQTIDEETESNEFPWLLVGFIAVILVLLLLLWKRKNVRAWIYIGRQKWNGWKKGNKKKTTNKKKQPTKAKSSTKSTKAKNKKKTKTAKKNNNTMARIKKTGTHIKNATTTKISQVVIFGKFMKDSFILAYRSATTSTKIPDIDKTKTVKCPYCGNMAHLEKKQVLGKTRWYCDDCGRWRRDLDENQQPISEKLRQWKKVDATKA
jgi:hypothetical protein